MAAAGRLGGTEVCSPRGRKRRTCSTLSLPTLPQAPGRPAREPAGEAHSINHEHPWKCVAQESTGRGQREGRWKRLFLNRDSEGRKPHRVQEELHHFLLCLRSSAQHLPSPAAQPSAEVAGWLPLPPQASSGRMSSHCPAGHSRQALPPVLLADSLLCSLE